MRKKLFLLVFLLLISFFMIGQSTIYWFKVEKKYLAYQTVLEGNLRTDFLKIYEQVNEKTFVCLIYTFEKNMLSQSEKNKMIFSTKINLDYFINSHPGDGVEIESFENLNEEVTMAMKLEAISMKETLLQLITKKPVLISSRSVASG